MMISMKGMNNVKVPHLVQYQGSKRNIAPEIIRYFPEKFNRLIEPFSGTCAMRTHTGVGYRRMYVPCCRRRGSVAPGESGVQRPGSRHHPQSDSALRPGRLSAVPAVSAPEYV